MSAFGVNCWKNWPKSNECRKNSARQVSQLFRLASDLDDFPQIPGNATTTRGQNFTECCPPGVSRLFPASENNLGQTYLDTCLALTV